MNTINVALPGKIACVSFRPSADLSVKDVSAVTVIEDGCSVDYVPASVALKPAEWAKVIYTAKAEWARL